MRQKLEITLPARSKSYPLWVGSDLLTSQSFIDCCKSLQTSLIVIVTDTSLEDKYADSIKTFLEKQGYQVYLLSFPPGEIYKTRETKEQLEDSMLQLGIGRDSCLIGVGGGIVTDVTGFLASTYCRGIPFISVPTSLLAMVDASIGGKTGVNVPQGKNLIGAIYHPVAVFMDCWTLKTLPKNEMKNGFVEMVKHGIIADVNYFNFMKTNSDKLLLLDQAFLEKAIFESCRIKKEIVQKDELETGMRRLLNFGHTIGHAIETATKNAISHGRAVAIGIIGECYLAMQLGYLPQSIFESIIEVFEILQIDLTWNNPLNPFELKKIMELDKKATKKVPRFVLIQDIGKPLEFDFQYCSPVPENVLENTLTWVCKNVMHSY